MSASKVADPTCRAVSKGTGRAGGGQRRDQLTPHKAAAQPRGVPVDSVKPSNDVWFRLLVDINEGFANNVI